MWWVYGIWWDGGDMFGIIMVEWWVYGGIVGIWVWWWDSGYMGVVVFLHEERAPSP